MRGKIPLAESQPHNAKVCITVMPRKRDTIQEFASLQSALFAEQQAIQQRLQQIEKVLGGDDAVQNGGITKPASDFQGAKRRGRPPRAENGISIREAITKVTSKEP